MIDNLNNFLTNRDGILKGLEIVFLAIAMISAIFIGVKQNDINEELVNLSYFPSVEIVYDDSQLRIINNGDRSIWVGPVFMTTRENSYQGDGQGFRLITPGGYYYFPADKITKWIQANRMAREGTEEVSVPFSVQLLSLNNKAYVAKNLLYYRYINDNIEIRTQTLSITESD